MQTLDNSITTVGRKGRFGWRMSSEQGHGAPNPTYIPIAYDAVRRMARRHRRHAGRHDRRALQPAADGPLHRRLHDRRLPADGRRGPLAAALRPRGTARRRRVGGLGQPRGEPVAHHHRAGRAGDGVLAQQGRGRPAPGARVDLPPARRRWSRRTRPCRRPRRGRCGCRSSASADPADFSATCSRAGRNHPSQRSLGRVRGPAVMLPPKGRVSRLGSCSQWLGAKPQGPITLPPRSGPGAFPARSRPDPGPAAYVDRLGA